MPKKFDAEAYVDKWDAKIIPIMVGWILLSLVLAVVLNVATRPDCIRSDYVFCGTEEVLDMQAGHHGSAAAAEEGHGAKAAAPAHEEAPH